MALTGPPGTPYADRTAAGQALARELTNYRGADDVVVLGLPRGGVPVAAAVARALAAPLDVLIVRKVGLPWQPELAMGAVAGVGGAIDVVRNAEVIGAAGVDEATFDAALRREIEELRRREQSYRGIRPAVALRARTVILIDDGLATGATMRAAVAAVRGQHPAGVVVAVPVAAAHTCRDLTQHADEVVCAWIPEQFFAVGQGYRDFRPTTDDEVRALLGTPGGPPGVVQP